MLLSRKNRQVFRCVALSQIFLQVFFPFAAIAAEPAGIVVDNRTNTTITDLTGGAFDIKTTTIVNNRGFNSFSEFGVAATETVNMHVPASANQLINLVNGPRTEIHGLLRGYKNGNIGGDIYFANPNGFLVGAEGVVNVGKLTLATPTTEFMSQLISVGGVINGDRADSLSAGQIPISESGFITIDGLVLAQDGVTLIGSDIDHNGVIASGRFVDTNNTTERLNLNYVMNLDGIDEAVDILVAGDGDIEIISQGDIRLEASESASVAIGAAKAESVIIIEGASLTARDIFVKAEASAISDMLEGDVDDGILKAVSSVVPDFDAGINGTYVKADADARVVVRDSKLDALVDLKLEADSEQTARTYSLAGVGGVQNAITAAVVIGELYGNAEVSVDGDSSLAAGTVLLDASNVGISSVTAIGTTSDAVATGALVVSIFDTDAAVSLADGTVVDATKFTASADNDSQHLASAVALSLDQENSKAGAAVAYSSVQTGAIVNAGGLYRVEDARFEANNFIFENMTKSSTAVGGSAITRGVFKGTADQLSEKLTRVRFDASEFPLQLGAAFSMTEQQHNVETNLAPGTAIRGSLADTSDSKADVVRVNAILSNETVRVHAEATTDSNRETTAQGGAPTNIATSVAVALSNIDNVAKTTVGRNSQIDSNKVLIKSRAAMPWEQTYTRYDNWSDIINYLNGNLGVANGFLTSFANATSETATNGGTGDSGGQVALAGAVSYLDVYTNSEATVEEGVVINVTGDEWTDAVITGSQLSTYTSEDVDRSAFELVAEQETGSVNVAGNISLFLGGTVAGARAKSLGAGYNHVVYNTNALATVHSDAVINATNGAKVQAASVDQIININPSAGRGSGMGFNGVMGYADITNITQALVDSSVRFDVANGDLVIDANEDLKVVNGSGALNLSENVGVGAGVAVNTVDTDTLAAITAVAGSGAAAPALYAASDALESTDSPEISGTSNLGNQSLSVSIDLDDDGTAEASYTVIPDSEGNWTLKLAEARDLDGGIFAGLVEDQLATVTVSAQGQPRTTTSELFYSTSDTVRVLDGTADKAGLLTGTSNVADVTLTVDVNVDGVAGVTYSTVTDAKGNWSIDLHTATPLSGEVDNLLRLSDATVGIAVYNDADTPAVVATTQAIIGLSNRADKLSVEGRTEGHLDAAAVAAAIVSNSDAGTPNAFDGSKLNKWSSKWASSEGKYTKKLGSGLISKLASSPSGDTGKPPVYAISGAGSVAVNVTDLKSAAAVKNYRVAVGSSRVEAVGDTDIGAGAGAAAITAANNANNKYSVGVTGTVATNTLDNTVNATVEGSQFGVADDFAVHALNGGIQEAVAIGLAINKSAETNAINTAITVAVSSNDVTNNTTALVKNSDYTALGATATNSVEVIAYDNAELGTGGGAMYYTRGGTQGGFGFGLSLAFAEVLSNVTAMMDDTTVSNNPGDLVVAALGEQRVTTGAGMAGLVLGGTGTDVGLGGAVALSDIRGTNAASILNSSETSAGNVLVSANALNDTAVKSALDARLDVGNSSSYNDDDATLGLTASDGSYHTDGIQGYDDLGRAKVTGVAAVLTYTASDFTAGSVGVAYVGNDIAVQRSATIENSELIVTGRTDVVARDNSLNGGVAIGIGAASSADTGASFAGAGSAVENTINNTVSASVLDSNIASDSLTVDAANDGINRALAGAISFAQRAAGAVSVSINRITNSVTASIAGNLDSNPDTPVDNVSSIDDFALVTASSSAKIETIAIGGSLTYGGKPSVALAGSVGVTQIKGDVKALVEANDSGAGAKIAADGSVGVVARRDDYIGSVAGSAAVSFAPGAGIAGAVTINDIDGITQAGIYDADTQVSAKGEAGKTEVTVAQQGLNSSADSLATSSLELLDFRTFELKDKRLTTTKTGVVVNSSATQHLEHINIGFGAANGWALGVNTNVTNIDGLTLAEISSSAIRASENADASVTASNHNYINGFLGAVAIGISDKPAGAAVAAGVDVTKVGRSTVASIRAADVESANDVEVDAQSSSAHTVTTMGGALAVSSGVGVGGAANVAFGREAGETYAIIENSLIAANNTTVNAQSRQNLHQLAGAISVGVGTTGVGVGASVLVAENYHRTHAWVDDSTVTDLGLTTANSVSVTAHSEKNYDTVSIAGAAGVGADAGGAIAGAVSLVTINSQTASGLAADLGEDDDQSDQTYVAAANLTNSTDKLGDIGLGNTTVLTAAERNELNSDLNLSSASSSNPVVAANGGITAPDGVGAWLLGSTLVKASNVEVSAEDKTHIDSDLGAVAISGSATLVGASVGAAVGVANVYNRVNAYVGDAVTITDLESLTVKAEALDNNGKTADIYSLAGAGSTGVAFAASVALANLENAVNASLGGNITMAEGDNAESYNIIVEANDTTSADTETTGVAVALFGAAGASVAQARKGNDSAGARANLGADITSSRSVDDYKFYWQQRGIDTEGGSTIYQPAAYDSNYQYSLSAIDKAGLSDQSVTAIETEKTNTYHAIHNSIGNVAYNPEFSWQDNLAALDIDVNASTSGRIDALAVGLSGGAVALGAVVAYAQDISTTQASLADGVVINAANADLSIDASAVPEVEATATGVNVGYLAVGGSFSTAESKTKVNAFTGSSNDLTLNSLDINARQLRSGSNQDGITANTRSVGGAGAIYGLVAADSESVIDSQTNARLGSENSLTIGSDLTLNASAVSKAVATTDNIVVGGIVVGAADATARSSHRVEASVSGSASGDVGGLMTVRSRSEEDSLADTLAGQGGAVSGVAADAISSVSGTSIAQIGADTDTAVDDTDTAVKVKDVIDWTVGRLNIVANHIGRFNSTVDTVNASVLGASGGTANNSGTSDVQAKLGADQKIIVADRNVTTGEGDVLIKAYNQLLKTNPGNTVDSGSGGLIDLPAVESFTRVNNQVTASVGDNVELIVEDNNSKLDQRSLEIVAVNELNIRDKVSLKSGGAIPIAKARSEITNSLLSPNWFGNTYNRDVVKVDIGDSAIVRNEDYESSVTLAARTSAKLDSTAHAKTWGFAASGTGDAITHYNNDNQINIANGATIYAEGSVYLRAGKDEDGVANSNFISSVVKVWNKSLTFFLDSENASATLDQNNSINVASGAKVQAVTDVFLDTATEDSSRVVRGNGEKNETNLGIAGDIASFSNDIFDGSDVVLQSTTGDAVDLSNFTVTVDGEVRAGVKNRQDMIVDYTGTTTQINLPGGDSVQRNDIAIDVTNGEGIDYGVRATVSLEDQFTRAIRSLENQILAFGGDNLAKLAMENDLGVLRNRRAELGVDRRIDIIDINNAYAASGNIHIDAEGVSGSGQLIAPAEVRIGIINNTHYFVNINDAKIPETAGGRLFLNGASFNETNLGGVQVDATADTDSNPLIQVYNSFNPNMDRRNDPYTNNPGDNGYLAPDIWIAGELINRRGTINILTDYGNIRSSGTIDAGQPIIQAPNGEFFQSYTPGFMNFGSAPWEQYGQFPEFAEAGRTDLGPVTLLPEPSVKSMILGKNIAISAQYININGSIQSGFADWNVVIDTPEVSLDYYDRLHDQGIQSIFSLQTVNASTGSPSVWYNAATKKIEMDPIRAQGGEIRLFGHVISTGNGQITARDGYGSIAIVNNTSRVLALNELDTGAVSDFGVGPLQGRVTLIDTAKLDANGRPLTSVFTRDNGVVTRNSYYEQEDGSRTAQSSQAGATAYNPVAGQRYHWVTGQTSTKRKTNRYVKETGWFFGERDWMVKDPGSFQYTSYKDLSPAEILEGNSGQYIQSGQSVTPSYLYDFTENPVADVNGDEGYQDRGYKIITNGRCIDTFLGACVEWRYVTDRYYEKGLEYLHNHSVYASYPIDIGFIGNEVEGAINISSGAGVDLTARVHNDTGLTTITAGGTGILATSDAVFEVDNLMLDANGAVNSRIGGSDDAQALTVRQTQIGSWISAMTQSGSINIDADFGNGLNVDSITSSGAVKLAADSNISTTATGAVAAKSITLASSLGVIGSASNALNIDTAEDGVLTASADGSIYLHETTGNLSLNSVVSRGGDIELLVDGDLLDGNSIEVDDELAINALLGLWKQAGLTGQDAQESIDNQIAAYESEKTVTYQTYWQARNVRRENGNYVADSYNPDFQYVLPGITRAGLTNSQISTIESNRTNTYHQVHTDIGGTAIFDDSYRFTLTDPDQIAALSRGGSWSEYELQNVLQSFLVKGDTQIRIEEANIAAAGNVVINAGGQVGNQSGVIVVAKEANPVAMSDSVRVALAAAERDDITFFTDSDGNTTGIQIEQKEDVDIEVGGSLSIVATGAAYIGSEEEDININTVTSGSDVRIKTDKGIVQVNSGITSIVAEDLILESASLDIGDEATPLIVELTGKLTARAAKGSIYLTQANGDLNLDVINAKNVIALTAVNGNILDAVKSAQVNIANASMMYLDASGSIGTQGDYLDLVLGNGNGTVSAIASSVYLSVEADAQRTSDTLKLNLVGLEGGKTTFFDLAIETQGAIEVDQLYAENGSLVSNAKTLKVNDAWITERALLSTRDITSVINNQDLGPELADMQLYSSSQYLNLLLQAGQIDTDARFIHGSRDLKLLSDLEIGETVITRVRDAVEVQLQGLGAIVTAAQQPIENTNSNIAIQRSLKNIQPNAAKWSDFSEGADEFSNKLPICTELLCAQPNKQSQQQTDTAPKEERLELSFRAQ
jgi:filamentous hemagglutinin family protein